ncbi:MAG: hypothetical protein V4614_01500 [Pseudomonadota bacterium]
MSPTEEMVAFYFELGLAITQWANVELTLFEVASACMSKRDRKLLALGYFNLESFRGKLDFVDGVVEGKIKTKNPRIYTEWRTLYDKTSQLSVTRNKLAHNSVMGFLNGSAGRHIGIVPWITKDNPKIKKKAAPGVAPSDALCVRDIISFRFEGFHTRMRIENLAHKIARKPVPFSRLAPQPNSPPPIHEISAQMRAMIQPQRQSSRA